MRKVKRINNYFYIKIPYFGAWKKYGWKKGDWGMGLEKKRIDSIAKYNGIAIVGYYKSDQKYIILAKKVQSYPKKKIKDYNIYVYVVPRSVIEYKEKELTEDEKAKQFSETYLR